jgi:hypothetical protein
LPVKVSEDADLGGVMGKFLEDVQGQIGGAQVPIGAERGTDGVPPLLLGERCDLV